MALCSSLPAWTTGSPGPRRGPPLSHSVDGVRCVRDGALLHLYAATRICACARASKYHTRGFRVGGQPRLLEAGAKRNGPTHNAQDPPCSAWQLPKSLPKSPAFQCVRLRESPHRSPFGMTYLCAMCSIDLLPGREDVRAAMPRWIWDSTRRRRQRRARFLTLAAIVGPRCGVTRRLAMEKRMPQGRGEYGAGCRCAR